MYRASKSKSNHLKGSRLPIQFNEPKLSAQLQVTAHPAHEWLFLTVNRQLKTESFF
jgi:hypothetical protein